MLTVRIQEKNHSESIMVLKLKDGKSTKARLGAAFWDSPKPLAFSIV